MERILSFLMLRSLKQARYSEENVGHFALAAGTYTHFTSPIRRYPDLIVHRILKEVLRDSAEEDDNGIPIGVGTLSTRKGMWERSAQTQLRKSSESPWSVPQGRQSIARHVSAGDKKAQIGRSGLQPGLRSIPQGRHPDSAPAASILPDILHEIAEESSESERRADDAERELMEWKKVKFMEDRIGEEFAGLIISVTKFGFFVELTDLFIEGLVPIDTLQDDRYTFRENTRQIIGSRGGKQYSLGDKVQVIVDRIEPILHKINFAVVEDQPSRAKRGRRRSY